MKDNDIAIDDVEHHMRVNLFPNGLTRATAATPMGFYLGWAILRGMVSDRLQAERPEELAAFRDRSLTGPELIGRLGGALHSWFLGDELRRFSARYYSRAGRFFTDYTHAFKKEIVPARSFYAVRDTWENQQTSLETFDSRLDAWRIFPPAAERIFGEEVGVGSYHALELVTQEALVTAAKALAKAKAFLPIVTFLTASDEVRVPQTLSHRGRMFDVASDEGVSASVECLAEGLARRTVQAFATARCVRPNPDGPEGRIDVRAQHYKSGPYAVLAPYTRDAAGDPNFGRPVKK